MYVRECVQGVKSSPSSLLCYADAAFDFVDDGIAPCARGFTTAWTCARRRPRRRRRRRKRPMSGSRKMGKGGASKKNGFLCLTQRRKVLDIWTTSTSAGLSLFLLLSQDEEKGRWTDQIRTSKEEEEEETLSEICPFSFRRPPELF